jgi:hypothetical protein
MGKAISLSMKNVFIFSLLLALCGCKGCRSAGSTPQAYKYKISETARATYSSDTTAVTSILKKMLNDRTKPFNLKMYDKETDFFIDSLVYSPDQLRMIVFVIARNATSKMLHRENDSAYFYDAYYLYCARDSMKDPIKIYDRAGYGLVNFYDFTEIREALKEYCFNRLLKVDDTEQHYNIDDIRFWTSKDFEWVVNNSTATTE